jgi:RNA polymerase sigma-70 factor (ECF subfamily)
VTEEGALSAVGGAGATSSRVDEPSPSETGGKQASDEELEKAWKAGSTPAFAVLFERYHDRVFRYVARLLRDEHAAEDVVQRTFLNLYETPPPGSRKTSFKALVFTVAQRESIRDWRTHERRGRREAAAAVPESGRSDATPASEAERAEQLARLRSALDELPVEERAAVVLLELEGLTFQEAQEVTGWGRDALRGRLARALGKLKRSIRGRDVA